MIVVAIFSWSGGWAGRGERAVQPVQVVIGVVNRYNCPLFLFSVLKVDI